MPRPDPHTDVVVDALRRMDPFDRQAVSMAYFGRLTQAQIAERLGRRRDAVAAAIARALRLIAASLDA